LEKCLYYLDIEFSTLLVNVLDDINNEGTLHSFSLKRKDRII